MIFMLTLDFRLQQTSILASISLEDNIMRNAFSQSRWFMPLENRRKISKQGAL